MNANNDDLDLKSLWQDTPAPDIEELLSSVRRSRTRMWQILAVEVIGSAAALLVLVIYSVWGVFADSLWIAAGVGALTVGFQAWTWRWRRGLWHALSDAPLDLLRLQRKRTRMNLKIARYYLWGTPVGVVIGVAFAMLAVDDKFSSGLSGPWRVAVITCACFLFVLTMIYGFEMANRCKRELTRIDARIAEFEEDAK